MLLFVKSLEEKYIKLKMKCKKKTCSSYISEIQLKVKVFFFQFVWKKIVYLQNQKKILFSKENETEKRRKEWTNWNLIHVQDHGMLESIFLRSFVQFLLPGIRH